MKTVEVAELGRASILTLMLKQLVDQNLRDQEKVGLVLGRSFTAVFRAGRMFTTLVFEGDKVSAREGQGDAPDLEVAGDMRTLLDLGIGRNLIVPLITRRLKVRLHGLRGLGLILRILGLMRLGRLPLYLKWLVPRAT